MLSSNLEKFLHGAQFSAEGIRRQAVEENLTVPLLRNTIIQQDQDAAIGLAADQAAEALLERERGLRNLVVVKRIAAFLPDAFDARFHHRIARNGERKLVDDDAAQLIALHVHALPERRGGEQHAVRGGAKLVEQRVARTGTLQQRRIVDF